MTCTLQLNLICCHLLMTLLYMCQVNINEMVIHVNKELDNLFTWFCANKLQLNTSKSKFMIFRPSNRATNMLRSDIMINNEKIDQIGNNCNDKSFKFLGVHLDENLTWNCHISHIHK